MRRYGPGWPFESCRKPPIAPSEGIGYQQSVAGFSFRASDAPAVPLEAIVRYAGASYVIAEMAEVGGDRIIVTVTPA